MRNRAIIPIYLILLLPIFGISNKAYGKMSFQCNYAEKIDQHYDYMEASPPKWKTKTVTVDHKFKIEIESVEGNSLDKAKIFYSDGPRFGLVRHNASYMVIFDFGRPDEDRTNIFSIFKPKKGDNSGLASTFTKTTHSMFFPTLWNWTGKCRSTN